MLEDDVQRDVRAAKEAYGRLHKFDVSSIGDDLRAANAVGDWPVVSRVGRPTEDYKLPKLADQPGALALGQKLKQQ